MNYIWDHNITNAIELISLINYSNIMIPNIVHFNYGLIPQEEEFLFVYYIAVLSCKLINKPDKIFFYYHYEPFGMWWEKTKLLVDLIRVEIPTHIGKKELKKTAHRSDILRMNILCKYGGIYLDIDTICVRSYKDLLHNKCVMAQEMTDSGKFMGLCNAIMMAEPNSKFMKEWYDLYEENFNSDGWQESSTYLPHSLSLTNPEITVLPRNSFLHPCWDKINLIFTDTYDIKPELIVLHFWNHYAEEKIAKIKNFDWVIEYPHTLYAKLLMNIYSKIVELPSQYLYQKLVYNDIITTINVDMYNKLNSIILNSNQEAQEHYILNKNCNLICNPLFRNDIRQCDFIAYKVFEFDIEIKELEDCFIDKIDNYYRIKLLNNINKLVLNEKTIIYNLNREEQIYIIPKNFKITQPVKNIKIKPNIAIFDTKFIISTHYISLYEVLLVIRRSDCNYGWQENLYLDITINEQIYYFYVGKSIENTMKVIIVTDTELEKVNLNYQQLIPKRVFQTWKNKIFDTELQNTIDSIIDKNPEYTHILYDDNECNVYIKDNFDTDVNFAYNNLIAGAFKSDLFRYCYLYKEGGIYMDCKMIANTPFRDFIKQDDTLILVDDNYQQQIGNDELGIYNAFMCAIPNQSVFKRAIDCIIENVKMLYFPLNPFSITGPNLLYKAYTTSDNPARKLSHPFIGYDHQTHHNGVFTEDNNIVIFKNYKNYYRTHRGGKYIEMYKQGICYKHLLDIFDIYEYNEEAIINELEFIFCPKLIHLLTLVLKKNKIVEMIPTEEENYIEINNKKIKYKFTLSLVANEHIKDKKYNYFNK